MVNKKQVEKRKINLKKVLHITFNVLIVIALISLGAIIYSQQKMIEWVSEFSINAQSADFNNNFYQELNVSALDKKAYIPEANLVFDYNYLASVTRYQLAYTDTMDIKATKATIHFTEAYQLIDRSYSAEKACINPFTMVIGEGIAEDKAEVASKTLSDGRVVVFAASKDDACSGYITGISGQDYLNFLKTVDSY